MPRTKNIQDELLLAVGKKHNKTVAQVVLRWLTQRGIVDIPKWGRRARIAENFHIFDFALSPADLAAIAALNQKNSLFSDHQDPAVVKWISETSVTI